MKSIIASLAVGVIANLAVAPNIMAEPMYALACIKNDTSANVVFAWKFPENSSWKKFVLSPGQEQIFSQQLLSVNQNSSPQIHVTYDDAATPERPSAPEALSINASTGISHCSHAKSYVFRNDGADSTVLRLSPLN